jgi:hypothetical protein
MVDSPLLNPDGSRLLVRLSAQSASWALYDAATGHLFSTYDAPEWWADPVSVSADLTRLYYLVNATNEDPTNADAVRPTALVAVDLVAGREIGRIALPEIGYGSSPAVAQAALDAGEPVHYGIPGLAVSPDGRRIAVVRSDGAGFTLLDAERLAVDRTVTVSRPTGMVRRLLTWLAIIPRAAVAKGNMEQERRFAVFSPDGQRLYVWGTRQITEMEEEREVLSGTGLVAIDLDRGAVLAQSQGDLLVDRLVPSLDGQSLYVIGPTLGKRLVAWTSNTLTEEFDSTYFVRRLDATSLDLLAAREFPDAPWLAPPQPSNE